MRISKPSMQKASTLWGRSRSLAIMLQVHPGTFAFSCNYAPGASDERPLLDLAAKVLGQAP